MSHFGDEQLQQLLAALQEAPPRRATRASTELVAAYLRHGGDPDACLRCLARLPIVPCFADDVEAACAPPLTEAKLSCIERYALSGPSITSDLVYAMRFTPALVPRILDVLVRVAVPNDDTVVAALCHLLHDRSTNDRAAQALLSLCRGTPAIELHVIEHVPSIAALARQHVSGVRLLQHIADRSLDAEDAIFDHALPALVARGPGCVAGVALLRTMAVRFPRALVRSGGLRVLLLAGGPVPSSVTHMYHSSGGAVTDDKVLAFMRCRLELPEFVEDTMRRVLASEDVPVRQLFANAFELARAPVFRPAAPALPDFDLQHVGTVDLVPADVAQATTVLLAPLARAAPFVEAHARNDAGVPVPVPLPAQQVTALVRALCYDDLPADDTGDTLYALAEVGHFWCATRLVHHCIDALARQGDFWRVADLARDWPEARELLRFAALDCFPELAVHERAHELNDFIWTCK